MADVPSVTPLENTFFSPLLAALNCKNLLAYEWGFVSTAPSCWNFVWTEPVHADPGSVSLNMHQASCVGKTLCLWSCPSLLALQILFLPLPHGSLSSEREGFDIPYKSECSRVSNSLHSVEHKMDSMLLCVLPFWFFVCLFLLVFIFTERENTKLGE